MASPIESLPIIKLAKHGHFEELIRRDFERDQQTLATIFEFAVTDFRTVKRTPGHQRILDWCLDAELDLSSRAGWLNQSVVCLAAAAGNSAIIERMRQQGLPDDPFVWASVGDVGELMRLSLNVDLGSLRDANGFNLLFNCAQSGLGRNDPEMKQQLTETCRHLLYHGVEARHEMPNALPIFPAFLCAWTGGNEEIMRLLISDGGVTPERFHQTLEHCLEPHQRSGEPFYDVAEVVLEAGFDINAIPPEQGRTLLHGAANRGTVKAVEWLLSRGADPHARDREGRTPLHVAAMRNTSTAVVKMLLNAGANANAEDDADRIPLDYAREKNRTSVVRFLSELE